MVSIVLLGTVYIVTHLLAYASYIGVSVYLKDWGVNTLYLYEEAGLKPAPWIDLLSPLGFSANY